MNEMEILELKVNAQKNICRNTLISRLESLKNTLSVEIERLKDENYTPSANGIIQSEACVIDTLSSKLNTLNEFL